MTGENPKPAPSFAETLKAGDHRASLEALRDELAAGMEEADPNVKPQYAARIQAVLSELAALPRAEGSDVDDLVERRKARRTASNAGLRAKQQRGA
jgi:hypothetical protein